jgi:hypothetical protein
MRVEEAGPEQTAAGGLQGVSDDVAEERRDDDQHRHTACDSSPRPNWRELQGCVHRDEERRRAQRAAQQAVPGAAR